MISLQAKKNFFLVITVFYFSLIFLFFLLIPENKNLFCYLMLQWLLIGAVCFAFPSSIYLTGTGILIFLCLSIFVFVLGALIFQSMALLVGIPLLIAIQLLTKNQIDGFSSQKRHHLLETEKIKEQLNDKKMVYENLAQKKIALDSQIKKFAHLRVYISQINLSLSEEHFYELILNNVYFFLSHGDVYSLALIDRQGKLVTTNFIVHEGKQNIALRPDQADAFNNWVVTYKTPLRVQNINQDYRFPIYDNKSFLYPKLKSLICSPLISDDKLMGVIRIDSECCNCFQNNDLRVLVIVANISALALKNAELFKEAQKLSITDGLTGLYLPHHVNCEIDKFLQSPSPKKTFSILMMDLDHFKSINDTFGHVVGDNVLIHAGRIINKHTPKNALSVRYGGEEFLMFLPGITKDSAFEIAEKIRKAFYQKTITVRREAIKFSVSIGVASFPEDGFDSKKVIQKADERLYGAKHQGRNLTVAG